MLSPVLGGCRQQLDVGSQAQPGGRKGPKRHKYIAICARISQVPLRLISSYFWILFSPANADADANCFILCPLFSLIFQADAEADADYAFFLLFSVIVVAANADADADSLIPLPLFLIFQADADADADADAI